MTERVAERYERLERLGGSGPSRTWLARDHQNGTSVVLKELSVREAIGADAGAHSLDGDDFTKLVELFEREAQVLAHLDHPGIPRCLDHFREHDADGGVRLYTVQEYVPGESLDEQVRRGRRFTETEARTLALHLAGILGHLHEKSPPLVHRDVKPSNIVLGPDGAVHLVDFGSVRGSGARGDLDGKTIVGTYGYMPMEQYEARAVPASDVYALGMTLVFLLSGRAPTTLPRDGLELRFHDHVNVSKACERTLERMIAPAPNDRYPDGRALSEALRDEGSPAARARPGSAHGASLPNGVEGRAPLPASTKPVKVQPLRWFGVRGVDDPVRPRKHSRLALTVSWAIAFVLFGSLVSRAFLTSPPGALPEGVRAAPFGSEAPTQPALLEPVDGVVTFDLDHSMRYVPRGFPLGMSTGQRALPPLSSVPDETVRLPPTLEAPDVDVAFTFLTLGEGDDQRVTVAFVDDPARAELWVDLNNDEDLTNDGGPTFNEGDGPVLAAVVEPVVTTRRDDGTSVSRPYRMWIWFTRRSDGEVVGRFYAMHHYAAKVVVDEIAYSAVVFEAHDQDGDFDGVGVCIDLQVDRECDEEREMFGDGDLVTLGDHTTVRIAIRR